MTSIQAPIRLGVNYIISFENILSMTTRDHHRKWTNHFTEQCSTFTSTIPNFNKYQTSHHPASPTSDQHMPQYYRSIASSLSRKESPRRMDHSGSLYDYLKTLSFVKHRHTPDCTHQARLKKRTVQFKAKKETVKQRDPPPFRTQHVHTVQTIFVPTPAPRQIIYQQPIFRQEIPVQMVQTLARPSSAPKINIHYVSPSKAVQHNLAQFLRPNATSNSPKPLESSRKHKGIEVVQQAQQARLSRMHITEQSFDFQQNELAGDASKHSQAMTNSFKIESANLKGSDILIYTFKEIEGQKEN